ncbi:RNA polymerase sigma-70 factor [Marinifilum caeruleilacunae]|uniref:RNA polymerase sigma-70 factor n=1 Tax=Marinifilum caeruleilacunae TaxID=2499076 RepID=A0ABX1X1W8_9BACT|nr:RNA polymerase sigma-70 factor [Marinifilum caeruleilacunae]NOU62078.1 RNA polymerase sigma-70 factor [Marinifilum caeruleilacunae]
MITPRDFESFKKGNRVVFKQIFDTFYKGLLIFARNFVQESDVAEDLVQEIFVKLWEKRETIENPTTIKAFLYVSVRNRALNHIRRSKIIQEHQKEEIQFKSSESFFKNQMIEEETYRMLLQAVDELEGQTKKVCVMSMNGVQNAQIAEELNLSTSTVKYHKTKAFDILRSRLKDHIFLLPILAQLLDL